MIKARRTRRKFYGKWLYKVTVRVSGVSIFRLKSVDDVLIFCAGDPPVDAYSFTTRERAYEHRKDISLIASTVSTWNSELWTKRIEGDILDLYTNEKAYYDEAATKLSKILVAKYEPIDSILKALDDPTNVIVKKYPHKIYKHKVYLLPHKMVNDPAIRTHYLDWLAQQNPRILITEAVKKWFINTNWNWDRRYVLFEDEKTLLMLKLRNSEVMGKVYNYVLTDK